MASNSPCSEPPGCSWLPQSLNGVSVQQCERCGQVKMDQDALQALTQPTKPVAVTTNPYGHYPFEPPATLGGFDTTPPGAPVRHAPTMVPSELDELEEGEPPPRPPTPRPTPTRLGDVNTVFAFESSESVEDEPSAPPRRERAPTPPPALRGVIPVSSEPAPLRVDGPTPLAEELQPLSAALEHPHNNATWAADDMPTTVDDTDSLGLRAAITRHDEPDLGLPGVDDDPWSETADTQFLDGETEELERFFTDEQKSAAPPSLMGAAPTGDLDDEPWQQRRSPLPMIALVAVLLLLIAGGLAVAAVAVMPDLQAQLGLTDDDTVRTEALAPEDPVLDIADEPASDGLIETDPTPDPEPDADPTTDPNAPAGDPNPVDPPATDPPAATAPDATPEPEPEPEPAPPPVAQTTPPPADRPAPPRPKPPPAVSGYAAKVRQGWNAVEGDANQAADHFRAALDDRPGDTEASYGLGYAMLKLGQKNGARAYLCAANKTASGGTKSEIGGILSNANLTCE